MVRVSATIYLWKGSRGYRTHSELTNPLVADDPPACEVGNTGE